MEITSIKNLTSGISVNKFTVLRGDYISPSSLLTNQFLNGHSLVGSIISAKDSTLCQIIAGNSSSVASFPYYSILDANIDCKSLHAQDKSSLFTTVSAAREANGNLANFLPTDNLILDSFTRQGFRENDDVMTVTSPFGERTIVSLTQIESTATGFCPCGHKAATTLTNNITGESVVLCYDVVHNKKQTDFGIAVNGIAFHGHCNIVTEDKCLGYAFRNFFAFSPSRKSFWTTTLGD